MTETISKSLETTNLADILERVLDKGIVIAGDIQIKLADVELLTIKIRLMIASVDKAKEMGINWWEADPFLSTKAKEIEAEKEKTKLEKKIEKLETKLTTSARSARLPARFAHEARRARQVRQGSTAGGKNTTLRVVTRRVKKVKSR